jgi:hypothetical protein
MVTGLAFHQRSTAKLDGAAVGGIGMTGRLSMRRDGQLSLQQALLDLVCNAAGFRAPLARRQGYGSLSLLVLRVWKGLMKAWPVLPLMALVAGLPARPALRGAAQL